LVENGDEGDSDEDELLTVLRRGTDEEVPEVDDTAETGCHREAHDTRRGGSTINPTVKAASPERRAGMLARLRAFREAYAKALNKLKKGLSAIFPGGTWQLCRTLNLPAGPAPCPAWQLA
jgi:hypothetical protein